MFSISVELKLKNKIGYYEKTLKESINTFIFKT